MTVGDVTQTQGRMTGYTSTTLNNVTTGAGVAFANYNLASDTYATASAKIIGATEGGVSVKVEFPDAWDRSIDGLPTNTKGLRESEFVKPTVKMKLIEVNKANTLKYGIGAATSAAVPSGSNPAGYTKITPKDTIDPTASTGDYLENITILTRSKGNPLIIVIKNPLSTDGFEFKTKDKTGGVIEVTFTGFYDPTNLAACPIEFYVPTA